MQLAAARPALDDFDMDGGVPLGCGAFACVNRVLHKPSNRHYAVKIVSKLQLLQARRVDAAMIERDAMYALGPHAGVAFLHGTMQSEDELYFVLDLLPNGDLLEHIRRVAGLRRMAGSDTSTSEPLPCLTLKDARLIAAQLVLLLDHVNSKGYALRDLKPENVAFDANGRAVLIDFDCALPNAPAPHSNAGKPLKKDQPGGTGADRRPSKVSEVHNIRRNTASFCGTAHYVSPEGLGENRYSIASDLFALGGLVFHTLAGRPVFGGKSSYFVMKAVKNGADTKRFPLAVTRHTGAEDFIRRLLRIDPVQRLGIVQDADGTARFSVDELKQHSFFNGFDWAHAAYPDVATRQQFEAMPRGRDVPYDDTPFHTDEYAQYVFQVGDGPLERYFGGDDAGEGGATAAADDDDDDQNDAEEEGGAGDDDDDKAELVSIEDDVGVQDRQEWRGGLPTGDGEDDEEEPEEEFDVTGMVDE